MMFNYEIFDVIYKEFRKSCDANLSDVIGLGQKYVAGCYEINLVLCDKYEINADYMTDFLNKEKCKLEEELEDWEEFGLCTGLVDYGIMMYCFYTECEREKETFDKFVSLAIN